MNDDDTVELQVVNPETWADIRAFLFRLSFDGDWMSSAWCQESMRQAYDLWKRMEDEG